VLEADEAIVQHAAGADHLCIGANTVSAGAPMTPRFSHFIHDKRAVRSATQPSRAVAWTPRDAAVCECGPRYINVTDKQTDRRTDNARWQYQCLRVNERSWMATRHLFSRMDIAQPLLGPMPVNLSGKLVYLVPPDVRF